MGGAANSAFFFSSNSPASFPRNYHGNMLPTHPHLLAMLQKLRSLTREIPISPYPLYR
jgi:hypothetical protein